MTESPTTPESVVCSTANHPLVQKYIDLGIVSLEKAMNDRKFLMQPECRVIQV